MANKLTYYRLKHNLTLRELAEKIGNGRKHNLVIAHEKGPLSAKCGLRYAQILGENVFDIMQDDVLKVIPKTAEDKQKLLDIIMKIEVED